MERVYACGILQIYMQRGKIHLPQRKCFTTKSIPDNYKLLKENEKNYGFSKTICLSTRTSSVHLFNCVAQNILCNGNKSFLPEEHISYRV